MKKLGCCTSILNLCKQIGYSGNGLQSILSTKVDTPIIYVFVSLVLKPLYHCFDLGVYISLKKEFDEF